MAAFDSYADLQTTVASYLKRNNLNDQIPTFIALAEARLNTLLRLPQQRTTFNVTPSTNYLISLPGDYVEMIRVTYNGRTLEFIPQDLASDQNEQYVNFWYTIIGQKFWLQTQIDGSKLSMHYYQGIEPLSTANTSNWLLEDYPNIYLYATLLEAAPFLVDDQRISVWANMLSEAVSNATDAGQRAQLTGGKLTIKRG